MTLSVAATSRGALTKFVDSPRGIVDQPYPLFVLALPGGNRPIDRHLLRGSAGRRDRFPAFLVLLMGTVRIGLTQVDGTMTLTVADTAVPARFMKTPEGSSPVVVADVTSLQAGPRTFAVPLSVAALDAGRGKLGTTLPVPSKEHVSRQVWTVDGCVTSIAAMRRFERCCQTGGSGGLKMPTMSERVKAAQVGVGWRSR